MRRITPPAPSPVLLLLAWLAVVVFPVLFFQQAALTVIDHEESDRLLAARGGLLEELGGFIDALRPERRIADTFRAIEHRLGFPARMAGRDFRFMREAAPLFAPDRLLPRLKSEIQRGFGASPYLLVTAGPDCATVGVDGDPRFFAPGSLPSPRSWQPLLMSLAGVGSREAWSDKAVVAQFKARTATPEGAALTESRIQGVIRFLLRDTFPRVEWGEARWSFTTGGGGERLWYYCQFVPASPASGAAIIGGFLAVFRNGDLPAAFFARPAQGRSDRGILRHATVKAPRFRRRNGDLQLLSPLPAELLHPDFTGTGNRCIFDPPGAAGNPPTLFVRRPAREIEHPLRSSIPMFRIAGTALILGSGLLLALFGVGMFQIPLRIRGQLGLAIALGMLMPMAAFWLVTRGYLGFLQRQERVRMLGDLRIRLADLEQLTVSHSRQEQRRFLEGKARLSDLLDDHPERLVQGLEAFRRANRCDLAQLIRSDGREWLCRGSLPGVEEIRSDQLQKMVEAARLMSFRLFTDLRITPQPAVSASSAQTIWTRSHQQMSSLMDPTEVGSLLQNDGFLFDTRFSGVRKSRIIQGYVPRAGPPPQPVRAILYVNQPAEGLFQPFFDRLALRPRLFRESVGGFYVRLAIFQLSDAGARTILPGMAWPKSAVFDPLLASLARQALVSNRGNRVNASDRPGDFLAVTRGFGHLPYIAVAVAEPVQSSFDEASTLQALVGLGAYTLLILAFLARFLHRVFVQPLQVIEAGGRAVADGAFATSLTLATGDEFQHLAEEFNAMTRGLRERERLQRFVSTDLMDSIRQGGAEHLQPGGERTTVTVMFCHLRDFPELLRARSTREGNQAVPARDGDAQSCSGVVQAPLSADRTVALLNRWFSEAEQAIVSGSGVIDKFMGDAFMAVFRPDKDLAGPTAGQPARTALQACAVACDLLRRLGRLNSEGTFPEIGIGVGIATGTVISGRIGSRLGRLDFTVIGDTVNLAARLESLSRQDSGNRVLIDAETRTRCSSAFATTSLGTLPVKGKSLPVEVFHLHPEGRP